MRDTSKGNNEVVPVKLERPEEELRLRHLTDDEIIRGFCYLIGCDTHQAYRNRTWSSPVGACPP